MNTRTPLTGLTLLLGAIVLACGLARPAQATPLNDWSISCSVDAGAITRKGKVWTFRPSTNRCPGGTFGQRAEIKTREIAPTHRGDYVFETTVRMQSPARERFDIFQIHDGRNGCAPPLKVEVLPDGRLSFDSAYKVGTAPGNTCVPVRALNGAVSTGRISRDGTPHRLQIILSFDGKSGFRVWVTLDGRQELAGAYSFVEGRTYARSRHFYFKHGVYSKTMFDYEMRSTGMKVSKVRLGG
ncbi:hypothetical protein GLS40_10110 [Pseudooceanicola sp. 216_PA32_1]|uniref:Polysaccharide lyase n=1 Tax=Pseudooceanicola pacificus TaxID=2676438 RepID=A0A844WEI8_9RHOB|nr:hypothetical protein [Pseudooceanicola pacificus]MWB78380.1 hypothetical protein [Pseudooceanicola pacificus]